MIEITSLFFSRSEMRRDLLLELALSFKYSVPRLVLLSVILLPSNQIFNEDYILALEQYTNQKISVPKFK